MKTINISEIDDKLEYCTCGQGCHLCSGTLIGFGTMYDYFKYFKEYPDHKGQTFNQWVNGYEISVETLNYMERRLSNELHN